MAKKKRRGKRNSKSQHQRSEFRDSVESHDEQELVEGEEKGDGEKKSLKKTGSLKNKEIFLRQD